MGQLLIEADQFSQAGPAFHRPMLTGSDLLVVLYMRCDGIQEDLLHDLSWHQGQTDRLLIPQILFPALFDKWASHLTTSSQLGPPCLVRIAAKLLKMPLSHLKVHLLCNLPSGICRH